MSRWRYRRTRSGIGILALSLIAVMGCGGSREEPPVTDAGGLSRATSGAARPEPRMEERSAPAPSPAAVAPPLEAPEPPLSVSHVLAGKELGMMVTGKGAAEPARSLAVVEQQIFSFLPQLQEIYEYERARDPGLMGSLDVSLTIDPAGGVSDLRFPLRRVSSEKLTAAVFDRMRAWTFPPAEDQVQLRYTLLFVPPGIDQASILLWEKQLGNRPVMERGAEPGKPVVVAAMRAPEKKPSPAASRHPQPVAAARVPAAGWYRVTAPTLLHAAPRDSSEVVAQLRKGTRVRVVSMIEGEWLEVRSVSNRPPGYLRREDVKPELDARAGRF